MTLSRFLRDYLYIPLGGNRRGRRRTYFNLMATMLLGGLWHGAAWTFVAWGGLHGAGLAIERFRQSRQPAAPATPASPVIPVSAASGSYSAPVLIAAEVIRAPRSAGRISPPRTGLRKVAAWLITFHAVCLGWIFFRATSFGNAWQVLGRLFATGPHVHLDVMVVAVVAGSMVAQWWPAELSRAAFRAFARMSVFRQALCLAFVLVIIDAFGPAGVPPFIYFRF
jgi:D-alanyl-lipoteichoic acid acyltransferase DltB (MBOAT superfamily)